MEPILEKMTSLDTKTIMAENKEMNTVDAVNTLHRSMFHASFNANDFFWYASAAMVQIAEEDFHWIIEHIEKYGNEGMESAMAYIQNHEPIPPYRTDKFNLAMGELVERKQEVFSDIDWDFYGYNETGPYRNINKD